MPKKSAATATQPPSELGPIIRKMLSVWCLCYGGNVEEGAGGGMIRCQSCGGVVQFEPKKGGGTVTGFGILKDLGLIKTCQKCGKSLGRYKSDGSFVSYVTATWLPNPYRLICPDCKEENSL